MQKLSEKYRPRGLADVIGQPPVSILRRLAQEPYSCCRLLMGDGGCGKTSAARAFAAELGCHDEFTDCHVVVGSDLTIDLARWYWTVPLKFMGRSDSGFKVLIIEELEWLSPQTQTFLKDALERSMPSKTIVIATSNGTGKLTKPLLQRFGSPLFFSSGPTFATAAANRLAGIWRAEAGDEPLPSEWLSWGWDFSETPPVFSLRSALDQMADHLAVLSPARAEMAGAA